MAWYWIVLIVIGAVVLAAAGTAAYMGHWSMDMLIKIFTEGREDD